MYEANNKMKKEIETTKQDTSQKENILQSQAVIKICFIIQKLIYYKQCMVKLLNEEKLDFKHEMQAIKMTIEITAYQTNTLND